MQRRHLPKFIYLTTHTKGTCLCCVKTLDDAVDGFNTSRLGLRPMGHVNYDA